MNRIPRGGVFVISVLADGADRHLLMRLPVKKRLRRNAGSPAYATPARHATHERSRKNVLADSAGPQLFIEPAGHETGAGEQELNNCHE